MGGRCVDFSYLEKNKRKMMQDKINGIYNRAHIIESDILKAKEHIMKKYKLNDMEALSKLSNLVIDKKLELVLDEYQYRRNFLKVYKIKNIGKI